MLARTEMTRAELIGHITHAQPHLNQEDVELAVKTTRDQMRDALAHGDRIEIRGSGAFLVRRRASPVGRNPKTGASVVLAERFVPYFRAGKELRERVDLHART
jgi:integration host factor subunit beta